jgi:hypothetical protein
MLSASKVVHYSVQSVIPEAPTAESANEEVFVTFAVTLKVAAFYDMLQTGGLVGTFFMQVFSASQIQSYKHIILLIYCPVSVTVDQMVKLSASYGT